MFACSNCGRFIRSDAGHCPFCDHAMAPSMAPVVAGALLGLTLTACGGETTDDGADSFSSGSVSAAAYAGPEFDTTDDPPDETNGGTDSSGGADASSGESGSSGGSTGGGSTTGTAMDGTGSGSSSGPEGSGSSTGE